MKAVVIGGGGFLGSHIADALSSAEHNVTIFDHRPSNYKSAQQTEIVGDIMDSTSLDRALAGADVVYHLAGIADIDECHKSPVDTIRLNVLGTTMVLEACVRNKIKKVIFASTAYVYGHTGSFYRVSKQSCELLVEAYHQSFGLNYVTVRYGSLYGPRSDRRNSLHRMIEDAITNKKIDYKGTGEEKREFIHVLDAAQLSVKILEPEFNNQNVTLTGTTTVNYIDLLNMIREMLHDKIDISIAQGVSETHYKLTPYSFNPRIGKKLTSNPHVDLGQGLLMLIADIHGQKNKNSQDDLGFVPKS